MLNVFVRQLDTPYNSPTSSQRCVPPCERGRTPLQRAEWSQEGSSQPCSRRHMHGDRIFTAKSAPLKMRYPSIPVVVQHNDEST